jgi:hypothetical protein
MSLKNFQIQYSKLNEKVLSKSLPNKAYDQLLSSKSQSSLPTFNEFPTKGDVIKRTFLTRKLEPIASHPEHEEVDVDDLNSSTSSFPSKNIRDKKQWLFHDKLSDPSVRDSTFLIFFILFD